jgi:hypothetical protein
MRAPTLWKMPTRSGPLGQRGHVRLGRVELRDDRVGVAEEEGPGLGERDGARPARPLDEPLSHRSLERRDLLADRGLRVAELACGGDERTRPPDRLEGREMPQLDITKIHRYQS